MKPRIFKERGVWWVSCKHGQRTGPYSGFSWAVLGAALLWEAYSPRLAAVDALDSPEEDT